MENTTKKLWFRRKTYGWGWTPTTWQGWLIIIAYVVLIWVFALTINENSSSREIVFTFFLPVAILTATMLRICYKKGEKPRWQWGGHKEE